MKLDYVPNTKEEFFELTIIEGERNQDSVKDKISKNISEYLTMDNPLINEIKKLLMINND